MILTSDVKRFFTRCLLIKVAPTLLVKVGLVVTALITTEVLHYYLTNTQKYKLLRYDFEPAK